MDEIIIKKITGLGREYFILSDERIMEVVSSKAWVEVQEIEDLNGNKCVGLIDCDLNCKYFDKKEILNGNMVEVCESGVKKRKNSKVVLQIMDGIVLKKFRSIYTASKETGIAYANIYNCCNNGKYSKTAGGFEWKYE